MQLLNRDTKTVWQSRNTTVIVSVPTHTVLYKETVIDIMGFYVFPERSQTQYGLYTTKSRPKLMFNDKN